MCVPISNVCWLDSACSVHVSVVSTCLVPALRNFARCLVSAVLYDALELSVKSADNQAKKGALGHMILIPFHFRHVLVHARLFKS